jgi:hypothetical protein
MMTMRELSQLFNSESYQQMLREAKERDEENQRKFAAQWLEWIEEGIAEGRIKVEP